MKLLLLAEGDANTLNCWSGSAFGFVSALRARGVEVVAVDVDPSGLRRLVGAAGSWHPRRERWRQRFRFGPLTRRLRTNAATAAVRAHADADAIVQVGGSFSVDRGACGHRPYVIYSDSNIRHAIRGAPFSGASKLAPHEVEPIAAAEAIAYAAADRVWCMSDSLSASFRSDFLLPIDRVRTIWAGANADVTATPSPREGGAHPPRVLFVGKDHVRKGSAVLLEAFREVRAVAPDAELHLVGGPIPSDSAAGVHSHGLIATGDAQGRRRLASLYESATVFCLPSHYEPFGIVFVEAMLAALPCIGVEKWAMPEIIVPGETGWLVPDASVPRLAESILEAIKDPVRARAYGEAGRSRALRLFTWASVADRALLDLDALLRGRGASAVAR